MPLCKEKFWTTLGLHGEFLSLHMAIYLSLKKKKKKKKNGEAYAPICLIARKWSKFEINKHKSWVFLLVAYIVV